MKLHPIVKEWRFYHKYCLIKDDYLSLFFVKRRAYKIFKKEAKQDSYSVKNLLNKAFPSLQNEDYIFYSSLNLHKSFWSDHIISNYYNEKIDFSFMNNCNLYFCVYCGISINFS